MILMGKNAMLKSAEEHNVERTKHFWEVVAERHETGVFCQNCGTELLYLDPSTSLMSLPPRRTAMCRDCGHKELLVC